MCLARCSFLPKRLPQVSSVQTNCGGSLCSRNSCTLVLGAGGAELGCVGGVAPGGGPPLSTGVMKFGGTGCRSITNIGGGGGRGDGDRQRMSTPPPLQRWDSRTGGAVEAEEGDVPEVKKDDVDKEEECGSGGGDGVGEQRNSAGRWQKT